MFGLTGSLHFRSFFQWQIKDGIDFFLLMATRFHFSMILAFAVVKPTKLTVYSNKTLGNLNYESGIMQHRNSDGFAYITLEELQ